MPPTQTTAAVMWKTRASALCAASDRVGARRPRDAVEGGEQAAAPGGDRVVGLEQRRRADAAAELEGAEQDVVGIAGRRTGEIGLALEGQARRAEQGAERGQLG